ncbi:MAG: HAMP domain-containing histidine kinase [Oscillatoria sp. SIO1A7]|nr:HAMP domain-containing histidine kinase [Oscillatoria sp. SIO1A7]
MKLLGRWLKQTNGIWGKIDANSLQLRLTVGIAAVSALGIGALAIWTSWKMQEQLVWSHKDNLRYIAARFPRNVEHYSQMKPASFGLQPAIDHLTSNNVLLWVKNADGSIAAKSMALMGRADSIGNKLMSMPRGMLEPEVHHVNDRYFVWCSGPLKVKGTKLGHLYLAQDITGDYTMFVENIRSFSIASVLVIFTITGAIAIYVRRSLRPVLQLSQIASTVSPDDLGAARMQLENAPSEVRELAQTCNRMLARLADAWEQQRQFVSNVSHELRTPLTIVSGYLQSTLRRGTNLTEPQREALSIASGEAERTIALLQDLLDLARADSGHLHFHLEPMVLNDLAEEVAEMAKQYSNREILVASGSQWVEVRADSNRLKQVLLNLIDNAVKYSEPDKPVTLRVIGDGDWGQIQVSDRGPGIPLPDQARIFERFYRIDEARSRSTGGTGLGLSIVKTLVEGMGGTVTVRSKLGEGSTFAVSLPAMGQ